MEANLITTTYLSVVIFSVFSIIIFAIQKEYEREYRGIVSGGLAWSLTGFFFILPFYLILDSFHITDIQEIFRKDLDDSRAETFWILVIFSFVSEIIRSKFTKNEKLSNSTIRGSVIFGTGWGISEFLTRYLFFFEGNTASHIFMMFVIMIILNSCLTIMLLRVVENSKFIMFAVFIRFFFEVSIFGGFGNVQDASNNDDVNEVFVNLFASILLIILITFLVVITRKRED